MDMRSDVLAAFIARQIRYATDGEHDEKLYSERYFAACHALWFAGVLTTDKYDQIDGIFDAMKRIKKPVNMEAVESKMEIRIKCIIEE